MTAMGRDLPVAEHLSSVAMNVSDGEIAAGRRRSVNALSGMHETATLIRKMCNSPGIADIERSLATFGPGSTRVHAKYSRGSEAGSCGGVVNWKVWSG